MKSYGAFIVVTLELIAMALCTDIVPMEFEESPHGPSPLEVRIRGCSEQPCVLRLGVPLYLEVDFQPVNDITRLQHQINVKMDKSWLKFKLRSTGGSCSLKNQSFPLMAGNKYTSVMELPIKKSYPKVSAVVEHIAKDQNGKVVYCYRVQGRLVDK